MSSSESHVLGVSADDLNLSLARCLLRLKPDSVLEYGSGRGKLGIVCKQLSIEPKKLVAVQKLFQAGDADILRQAGYTDIVDDDVLNYLKEGIAERYDMIAALDVIEHFFYSDAISIIDYSLYCCDYFLLIWPTRYPQHSDNRFEIHRTSFTLKDLADRFDVVFYTQTSLGDEPGAPLYHLCVLNGHMKQLPPRPPIG